MESDEGWHWGGVAEARRAAGCRTLCALWGATHLTLPPGARFLLRYPIQARRGSGRGAAAAQAVQEERWVLGVVQERVENCFLLEWAGFPVDNLASYHHVPYDLAATREALHLARAPAGVNSMDDVRESLSAEAGLTMEYEQGGEDPWGRGNLPSQAAGLSAEDVSRLVYRTPDATPPCQSARCNA